MGLLESNSASWTWATCHKVNQVQPILLQNLNKDIANRLVTDSLMKDDVYIILKTIFDLNIVWSRDEVLKAWDKSRSVKNDEFSSKAREEGNAKMKVGQWSKALTMYNEAVILANPESQARSPCPA